MNSPTPNSPQSAQYILHHAPALAGDVLNGIGMPVECIGRAACEIIGSIYDHATAGLLASMMDQPPNPSPVSPFVVSGSLKQILEHIKGKLAQEEADPACDCEMCQLRRSLQAAQSPGATPPKAHGGN